VSTIGTSIDFGASNPYRRGMSVLATVTLALVLVGACGGAQTSGGGDVPPRLLSDTDTRPPTPATWPAIARCSGINFPPGSDDPTNLRASHVVDAVLESASCWLDERDLATLDQHRRGLPFGGNGMRAALVATDRAVRELAPIALDAVGRGSDAATLRALSPIVDEQTRAAAETVAYALVSPELQQGALPPPGKLWGFVPSIVLDEGHGCTLAKVPTGLHINAADAAMAAATMTLVNVAERPPATVAVSVDGQPAQQTTVGVDPQMVLFGSATGLSATACFAALAGVDRARLVTALETAIEAIDAAR
jgi:hypothetical protein